ncbi:MAG: PPC domain-containing protein [Chloroflexi bacterium]|nr:hypothetical protein [Chloroflexota bacterium]MBV6435098.1 hypothetical protein [Anaerolineae bacterium]MCC6567321.1 PPC domain-containing protein [Chloroflexota bacterium]RIK21652.1 MAG: hypothetical protein DCC53_06075 [Chloroflexota bacterium]
MNRVRLLLIATLIIAVAAVGLAQPLPLTVTPPAGPVGTNHEVVATGLQPNSGYRLEVVLRETGVNVFTADLVSDSNGQAAISLLTEPTDAVGIYDLTLFEGDIPVRTGTITITAPFEPPSGTTLSYGDAVEGALAVGQTESIYLFDGAEGDIVTIVLRSSEFDAFLWLYGPDGAQLRYNDNGLPPTSDAALTTYTLPATGRYTIVATSREAAEGSGSAGRGSFTLTLTAARVAQEGAIAPGETITGELGLLAQRANYTFNGRAGDVITVDLRSEAFDSYLRLFTSDGEQLAQDDDGGGGLNARISRFVLPSDGEYVIVVDGFRGFTGERRLQGVYTVSLEIEGQGPVIAQATPQPSTPTPVPAIAGAVGEIDYGETTVGELTEQAQTGVFRFNGTAGDRVTIALNSDAFDPKLRLVGPDGTVLAEDDDSGPDLNALISEFTLPRDGEYVIEIDGFRGASGDRVLLGEFSLSLTAGGTVATAPTQTPESTPVPQAGGAIIAGQTLTGEFTESVQSAVYEFTGRAGDTVTIDLRSDEIDPLVRLIGPDGTVVAEDDDSGGGVQARISEFTLPADGTYTIEVDAFRGIDSHRLIFGAFELSLSVVEAPVAQAPTATPEPATPEPTAPPAGATPTAPSTPSIPAQAGEVTAIVPGDAITLTFEGGEGEQFEFSFEGSAGDIASFNVLSDGAIDTAMEIQAIDGLAVASDDDSGPGADPELLGVELPAYGGYRLIVRPVAPGATGTATLNFLNYVGTAIGEGGISVSLNDKFGPQSLRFTGHAGETVRLVITSVSQIGGEPEIVVSQGAETLANQVIGRNLRLTFEFVTPSDGRVDVKVLREAGAYGELQISLERVVEEEETPTESE